ncbi:C40 family peptidase [Sphaerisporangium sp. TRM90804]|uniref:C40 family peptidase n=1 Tax=Sphaerisporangium sp. TRM90804 TaxID=3031113 RepID=UPI00244C65A5|nr:C40 family peptidase [Sphaerisporangium sp. TRM90804]MDH2424559.1 NlpC/P60 family protein [Sphaerisporangium sp. TRM90804]
MTAGLMAVVMVTQAGGAGAEPKPTAAQAKARLEKLSDQADKVVDKYNDASERYKKARKAYNALNGRLKGQLERIEGLRAGLVSVAVSSYQTGDLLAWPNLITQGDPDMLLSGLASVDQLSAGRSRSLAEYENAIKGLKGDRDKAKNGYDDALKLLDELREQKKDVEKLVGEQERLLRRLNAFKAGNPNSGGIKYTGPASGNARAALQFAYAQVGKPYRYGGTGPGSWDCSGLTQAAWRAAGVSLPRTAASQYSWGASRRVPLSALQPGDLVFRSGLGHVGMYAGDGKMVHAPRTGDVVKVVPLSSYHGLMGAIRP